MRKAKRSNEERQRCPICGMLMTPQRLCKNGVAKSYSCNRAACYFHDTPAPSLVIKRFNRLSDSKALLERIAKLEEALIIERKFSIQSKYRFDDPCPFCDFGTIEYEKIPDSSAVLAKCDFCKTVFNSTT